MNNNTIAYIKKDIFSFLIHPITYIVFLGCVVGSAFFCFLYRHFFYVGIGNTDLHYFFIFFPYLALFFIPLCAVLQESPYDSFLPLSAIQKVCAQWVAGMILCMGIVLSIATIPLCIHFFGFVDLGQVISGYLGIILFLSFVYAVALCMASVCSNRFVAYIFSVSLIFVLNYTHKIDSSSFAKGIIDTRLVIQFGIYTFLALTIAWIHSEKKKGKRYVSKYIKSFILCALLILLNNTRYYHRFDITQNKSFSLHPYTQALAAKITQETPLRITYICSKSLKRNTAQVQDIIDFLQLYCNQSPYISFTQSDADQTAVKLLQSLQVVPQQLPMEGGEVDVYSCILMEYSDRIELLPFVIDIAGLEYDLDIRVDRLFTHTTRQVYVISGTERNITSEYSAALYYLQYQGYTPIVIQHDQLFQQVLDAHIPAVLIGSTNVTKQEVQKIEVYLSEGGKLFSAVAPYTVAIDNDWRIDTQNLDPFLQFLDYNDITFTNSIVSDDVCANVTVVDEHNNKKTLAYPLWPILQVGNKQNLTLFWPAQILRTENPALHTVLQSTSQSRLLDLQTAYLVYTNPLDFDSELVSQQKGPFTVMVRKDGDIQGLYSGLESTPTASLVVLSDPYFVHDMMLSYSVSQSSDYQNLNFFVSSILQLQNEQDLAVVHDKSQVSYALYPEMNEQTFIHKKQRVLFLYFILFPCFAVAVALFVAIRRKQHESITF